MQKNKNDNAITLGATTKFGEQTYDVVRRMIRTGNKTINGQYRNKFGRRYFIKNGRYYIHTRRAIAVATIISAGVLFVSALIKRLSVEGTKDIGCVRT